MLSYFFIYILFCLEFCHLSAKNDNNQLIHFPASKCNPSNPLSIYLPEVTFYEKKVD